MHIFSQIKIQLLSLVCLFLMACVGIVSNVSACSLFDGSDCESNTSVNYCNSDDPKSAKYCSLDRGTQVVSGNINDIEKGRKFSVYIQDIVVYLLGFLAIVGVLYIIYAGFNILTAGGDEDKVKKSKTTIVHVVIGLLLIFLAFSIVKFLIGSNGKGGILNNAFELPSFIATTYAYTEYDLSTFDSYKKQIELLSPTLDREYQVGNKITIKTLTTLEGLVKSSMETFSDSDENIFNTNLANSLLTAIELVKKTPDSDTAITNLAKNLNDYLTKIRVKRIKGKIIASPESGNAPVTVTLRASEVVDPSGVTVQKENYKWWIRTSGGKMSPLGTGPSINHTFLEERTYTVFLNILSSSRNKNGKIDVLPFDASINVNVLPKLGNLSLAINGIYVSNLNKIKFTPAQARQGLLIDPTASTAGAGTKFVSTRIDFGNGNISQYNSAPLLERQIYFNEGNYKLQMEVMTNENQKITKDLDIEIRDPISSIRADKTTGAPRDEFRFTTSSSAAMLNLGYAWQILDESEKSIFTSSLPNITYKFLRTGKYTVKLKTLASNGKDDYDTLTVTIEGRDPVASFDTKTLTSEMPNVLVFDATKSYDPDNLDGANLAYAWIIDGVRTDIASPTRNGAIGRHTFDTIGTHKVTLEVSNKEGKIATQSKDINIDSLLAVRLIVSPKIIQAGAPISFIADSKEAQIFEWQFGDGDTDTSNNGRMTHIYKKSGTYTVNLTVRGRGADNNSISRKVYVMDSTQPFAIITLKRESEEIIPTPDACEGKEAFVIDRAKAITMSAENSVNTDGTNQGIAYTWKYGNRNSSQKDFSYKFDELGCFPITLSIRSQKTGVQDKVQAYVKIENIAPKLSSLSVATDKPDADPVTVTVTANNAIDDDGAITSYIWYYYTQEDPEPQDFRITRSPKTVFVLPRVGAKYYFAVILEDSNGLKVNSDDMSTERHSLTLASDNINTPIIALKASATNISIDQKIDFTVTAKNILGTDLATKAEYKWDYNGDGFYEETTNTPVVTHAYDKPGNFNFKVKVTYKGISNTKYQAINVKNEVVPNLEYIAIGKKFIFLNTTKGLYTKVKWTLGEVTSTTPDSFIYDFGEDNVAGNLIMDVSDGTDTKQTSIRMRKDVINAMKLKKTQDKLVYFTYPSSYDSVVHIQNSTDKLYVYLGESKGTIGKYGIDVDTGVDSNLNGDPGDDIDNKGTDSSVNGSVFVIKNTDVTGKEKIMRLTIYDSNNAVMATKDIKVVYDFMSGVSTESLSGSTADALPKDISDIDKANLEKLKDLIRSTKEQDRLKMMQYFSALQENWFDAREKTKTIIDFESYIDTTSALDNTGKEAFYSLLEGFLLSESQVKDDIGLATKVLKSLIPKTHSSYTQIMKNIDDIISHPTNTALNKELGTFILNAIKTDTTIETKDKNIIKSQLQTIIYGGQNNIPASPAVSEITSGPGGALGFILSTGKYIGFFFLIVLALLLITFIYFKISNKDSNIGFQDFIIDALSGKKSTPASPSISHTVDSSVSQKTEPVARDILANMAQSDVVPVIQSVESSPSQLPEALLPPDVVPQSVTAIPDWLRASTSLNTETSDLVSAVSEDQTQESQIDKTTSLPNQEREMEISQTIEGSDAMSAPLPDWLKGSESTITSDDVNPSQIIIETVSEPGAVPDQGDAIHTEITGSTTETISDLPAWMQGVDQESIKQEMNEDAATISMTPKETSAPSYEDIPDWLKVASMVNEDVLVNAQEPVLALPPEIKQKHKTVTSGKKPSKEFLDNPNVSKKDESQINSIPLDSQKIVVASSSKTIQNEEISIKPKKKKISPAASPAPVISADPDELPDWLK